MPGRREEQAVHQLDLPPVVAEQRRQAPADAEVDPRPRVAGVDPVHVVALLVGDHLQGQLVVVAQEDGPLAALGDGRRLLQDVDDREAVLHVQRHVHPGHHREVERHVALVPVPEVGHGVLGPLVGLGQEHPVLVLGVDVGPELLEVRVGLREVLAGGPLALVEVGDGVEAQAIDPHVQPEVEDLEQRRVDLGVVEVEVGLVVVEAVPVVGLGHRIPAPVGVLEVLEDDPGVPVAIRGVAPHVEVAPLGALGRAPRPLEPGVLVGGVVEDQLGDHPEPAPLRLLDEALEVAERPVVGVHPAVVGDVVAVVPERRGVEGQEPQGRDPQVLEVVELLGQPPEVAHPVAHRVEKGADVELVDDRVAVPERVVLEGQGLFWRAPGHERPRGSSRSPARCAGDDAPGTRGRASPPDRAPRSWCRPTRGSGRRR